MVAGKIPVGVTVDWTSVQECEQLVVFAPEGVYIDGGRMHTGKKHPGRRLKSRTET
jgi:hypothetical protein